MGRDGEETIGDDVETGNKHCGCGNYVDVDL